MTAACALLTAGCNIGAVICFLVAAGLGGTAFATAGKGSSAGAGSGSGSETLTTGVVMTSDVPIPMTAGVPVESTYGEAKGEANL